MDRRERKAEKQDREDAMTHEERMKALVEAGEKHADAKKSADNGMPHWEDSAADFRLRMAFTHVASAACDARHAIALAAEGMRLLANVAHFVQYDQGTETRNRREERKTEKLATAIDALLTEWNGKKEVARG